MRELGAREETLEEEIAETLADDGDADALREERTEVRELRSDLEAAVEVLEDRILQQRRRHLEQRAQDRLETIKKKVGGLAGQVPGQIEEAEELTEKLVRVLTWLYGAQLRRKALAREAGQLAEAFGLDVPDMKRIPGRNAREGDPNAAAVRCGRKLNAIQEPTEHILTLAGRAPAKLLKTRFDEKTPTPQLLAELEGLEHPKESVTREGDGPLVIEYGPDRFRVDLSDGAWAEATRERDRFLAQDRADDRLALRRFFVRDLDLPREFFDGLEMEELRELSEKVDAALEGEGD